jgi:hypothetical protein
MVCSNSGQEGKRTVPHGSEHWKAITGIWHVQVGDKQIENFQW